MNKITYIFSKKPGNSKNNGKSVEISENFQPEFFNDFQGNIFTRERNYLNFYVVSSFFQKYAKLTLHDFLRWKPFKILTFHEALQKMKNLKFQSSFQ